MEQIHWHVHPDAPLIQRHQAAGQRRLIVHIMRDEQRGGLMGPPEFVHQRLQRVTRLLREYKEVGVENFILSGYPHLEDAYRKHPFGQSHNSGPFGETVANAYRPATQAAG
ncbi:hypothetical protein [Acidocella aromatica]|uniref:Uncharacterized protein n=1 Tax=Acidocella aromatica TaxID=1303579 RepID=A0A840VBE9_9PROT|nr:hypothetical protein [Acidocella aromatica]MBB5372167.1 hypothetical protein [Acidocella aromatica]